MGQVNESYGMEEAQLSKPDSCGNGEAQMIQCSETDDERWFQHCRPTGSCLEHGSQLLAQRS